MYTDETITTIYVVKLSIISKTFSKDLYNRPILINWEPYLLLHNTSRSQIAFVQPIHISQASIKCQILCSSLVYTYSQHRVVGNRHFKSLCLIMDVISAAKERFRMLW